MRLFAYPFTYRPTEDAFAPLAPLPYALFFDSAKPEHPLNQYSYICAAPFETIESKNGQIHISNADQNLTFKGDAFDIVKHRLHDWCDATDTRPDLPPFQGGAAGFFGYDLARQIEKLSNTAKDDEHLPDMAIGIYDKIIAFDHTQKKSWVIIRAKHEAEAERKKQHILKLLNAPILSSTASHADIEFTPDQPNAVFKTNIAKVIEYIYAGDIFQANLTRRYSSPRPAGFDTYEHYLNLRRINPAPFAAFMNFDPFQLSSSSPESFLSVTDGVIETRPIKGTLSDKNPPQALRESEKDTAENMMIVDLLRNDLSKVCDDHTITVPQLCGVESFAGLHHLVSIVRGVLRADQHAIDALKACFPGGSITGAPKVRAMEIIEELEPTRRNAYCGAMGMIGFDGYMNTNIIIRTLIYTATHIHLNVGGGIVADSIPENELKEAKLKAEKILESFKLQDRSCQKAA